MIEVRNVSKIYGGEGEVKALQGVDLYINKGEIFGIIGPSGAGKSTLLRCINLLETPTTGEIWFDGVELTGLSSRGLRRVRQKMGMIFQHFNLLSSRTVTENVEFPLEIIGMPKRLRRKKVKEMLELVGLTNRADHYPSQLSGGQKQRVGIARSLASDPKVLLCDEATSALDPATTRSILELIKEINLRLGLTVVLITHEMDVIRMICDRVAVMDEGLIKELDDVQKIFIRPESSITKDLLGQVKVKFDPTMVNDIDEGWILKITFVGPSTKEPIISQLIQKYRLVVNILAGNIEQVHGEAFGELVIKISGDEALLLEVINDLLTKNLSVEVLGHGRDSGKFAETSTSIV